MIIYSALAISLDAITGNLFQFTLQYYFICFTSVIIEALIFCYMKYMMDKLYYQYTEVIIYNGISGLIAKICMNIGIVVYRYINNKNNSIFETIKEYFKKTNVAVIIFFQFLYFLTHYGITNLLMILIIYYLRPNHLIINDELLIFEGIIIYSKISNKEKNIKISDKYYSFIPFVFQILCLLFYFEILELNFCSLNKNTVKNIQARERNQEDNEQESRNSFNNNIELVDQYYLVDDESSVKDREINDNNEENKTYDD